MSARALSIIRWIMVAALFCIWLPCHAQFGSSVQGTVTDPTGAVVTKVAVTLHNTGTGVDLKQTTNMSGFYRFQSVAPGEYAVIAQQAGFKTASISVTVTPDETRGVDVTLTPAGSGAVNVTVNGVAPDLNPEETRIQTTLASDEITKLPMAGHDVQQILALTPGVTGFENTQPGGGYGSTLFAGNWAPPFQANGQGINGNLYLLDDLPVNDDVTQGAAIMFPNADMIDQVSMQTQTYSVENGISASLQTSFNTKSGGNKFHGDLDYTYAGANLAAADNVINTVNTPKGVPTGAPSVAPVNNFHQNEFLGSLGGPLIKDKTFFFFSIQKQNQGSGATTPTGQDNWDPAFITWGQTAFPDSALVKAMTLAPNTADISTSSSQEKTVEDVLGSTACPTSLSTYSGTTVASNDGAISGPNKGIAQGGIAYSIPCSTKMYDHGYVMNQSQPFNGLQFSARIDQVFRNGNDRIYLMFERIHQTLGDLTDRPALGSTTPSTNRYSSVNWIHVFSPKLLNEIHVGNVRTISGQTLSDATIAGSIPYGMIGIDTTDGYQFWNLFGGEAFAPDTQREHTYNLRDTVSYSWRNHTIRGGYQFAREDYIIDDELFGRGGFGFNFGPDAFTLMSNQYNFSSYLWSISGLTGSYSPQIYGATSKFNGIWADDSWKVRPNLTVTAGIRYDDFGNPARYSNSSPFSPLYPGAGSTFYQQALNTTVHVSPNAFTQSQNMNFQPRVGFAYTPFKTRELTIHGGFGLYENALTPEQVANNLPTQPPSRISLSLSSPIPFGDFTTAAPPWGETYDGQMPFPVFGQDPSGNVYSNSAHTSIYSVNLNGFDPTITPEKFLLDSIGVEQELPGRVVVGASYSGSHGYDLVVGCVGQGSNGISNCDWNLQPGLTSRPATEWGQLLYTVNAGTSSNFNAVILTLKQHYKGLSYQANYNFERAMQWAPTYNDTAGGNKAFWPAGYQAKTYYGPSSFDIANSFSFGGTYEVPKLSPSQHYLNQLAGWRISTITVAQTGTPFSVGNTGGPSYAFDNSLGIDSAGTGTPAFPTPSAGAQRKGFSRKQVSQTGAFAGVTWTDPAGAGTQAVLSQQGANTFRNPGYFNVNAGLAKTYDVPWVDNGTSKFTMRADFINLLNRTNWGPIDNDLSKGAYFGFSTTTGNKRFLQIGGRFEF